MAAAAAAQKTDVLTLNNGDRVTCEIKSYSNGYLTVSTDHSGTINVKWNRLVGISSAKQFDIETTDGIHHFGSLALSDPPGKLVIVFADGNLMVAFLEVFDIAPVYRKFWLRIEGSLDLGFNYTQSTNLTQFNLNANATYRERNWSATTELSSFYSRQEEADAAKRGSLKMRYDRFLPGNWVAEGGVGFEKNVQLGLDLRTSLAVGGGKYFVKTNQTQLLAFAGLLGNQERPVEGEVK